MITREKPLILCIEDEEDLREILRFQLQAHFELVFAADGKEGVRQAIFHRPDLILMDLMMPNIDGIQASGMIKSIKALKVRPLVALTAAPKQIQQEALAAGCDLVIQKPARELVKQLKEFLAKQTSLSGSESLPENP